MKSQAKKKKSRRSSNPVEWFIHWVDWLDGIEQDNVIAAFLPGKKRRVKTSSLREIAARPIIGNPPDMVKRVMNDFEEIFEYTMKHGKKRRRHPAMNKFKIMSDALRSEAEQDGYFVTGVKILLQMNELMDSLPKVEQWSEEYNAMKERSHEILNEAKDIFNGEDYEFAKTLPDVLMKHHLSYYERFERLKEQWEPFHKEKFNLPALLAWEQRRTAKLRSAPRAKK